LTGTELKLADKQGHDVWKHVELSDCGDVLMNAELNTRYLQQPVEGLFVFRHNRQAWEVLGQPGQEFGQPPQPIRSVSHGSINRHGQVTFVLNMETSKRFETTSRLLRIEPDGAVQILNRDGDRAVGGTTLRSFGEPRILASGQVVFTAVPESFEPTDRDPSAIAISDGRQLVVVATSSAWQKALPKFRELLSPEFKAADSGHVGICFNWSPFDNALLLATPQFR